MLITGKNWTVVVRHVSWTPLVKGVTLAIFHSQGIIREVIELLIITIKGQEIAGAVNFAEIFSIPMAFDSDKEHEKLIDFKNINSLNMKKTI